jgi:hypothetical protein
MKFKIITSYLFIFQAFCGSLLFGAMASTTSNPSSTSMVSIGDTKASATAPASLSVAATSLSSLTSTTAVEHKVSAIESKDAAANQSMVIVLFGTSGSGKTRLSHALKAKIEEHCTKNPGSVLAANKKPWRILAVDEISAKLDQQGDEKVEEEQTKEQEAAELDRCLAYEHEKQNSAISKLLFRPLDTSKESDDDDDDDNDKEVANASDVSSESEEDNDGSKEVSADDASSDDDDDKEVANASSSEEGDDDNDDDKEEIEENEALSNAILEAEPTHNLICDTVFEDGKSAKAFMAKLAHLKNLYRVLVYCNIGTLAERTASRNSLAQSPSASMDDLSNGRRSSASLMRQYTTLYIPIPLRGATVNASPRIESASSSHAGSASASHSGSSSALYSGSSSISRSQSNSSLHIIPSASPSPRLTSNPTSFPHLTDTPILGVISEDDFNKAFTPAVNEVTEKVEAEVKMSQHMRQQMSQQLISGLSGNFSSAFTPTKQEILVSPTPSINEITDLSVSNNTTDECKQAVEQIIQLVISRQTTDRQ